MFSEPAPCPTCDAAPGQPHDEACDIARCAETGLQDCSHQGDICDRQTLWHGHWPGEMECWEYGFLLPQDTGGSLPPQPDLMQLYTACVWNRDRQRWVLGPSIAQAEPADL